MSSREIAVDMGVYPDNLEEGRETDSLASGSAHSHTRNPEDPVRFSDLVHLGQTACQVIMTQRGTGVCVAALSQPAPGSSILAWAMTAVGSPATMLATTGGTEAWMERPARAPAAVLATPPRSKMSAS